METRTYRKLPGRVVPFFAASIPRRLLEAKPPFDPEFETFTAGVFQADAIQIGASQVSTTKVGCPKVERLIARFAVAVTTTDDRKDRLDIKFRCWSGLVITIVWV